MPSFDPKPAVVPGGNEIAGDNINVQIGGTGSDTLNANTSLSFRSILVGGPGSNILNGNNNLFFDIDGKDGAPQVQIATLTGAPSLTASQIVVFL